MDERKPTWKERWALGREVGRGMRAPLRWSLLASVVLVALSATYFFGKTASLAEARGELSGPAHGSDGTAPADSSGGGDWAISRSTDPMTDVSTAQAAIALAGQQYDAEVTVTCGNDGNIAYSAASFDKDRQPAEMRSRVVPFGSLAGTWIDYQMRADDGAARALSTLNPAYNNQIVLKSAVVGPLNDDGSGGDEADEMAAASKVVLRLFMASGEETFEWPQNGRAFRSVVKPCLEQRHTARDRVTREWNEELARRRQDYDARVRRMNDSDTGNAVTGI
jgi:hypothetical protein